jgi:hypothetical protein
MMGKRYVILLLVALCVLSFLNYDAYAKELDQRSGPMLQITLEKLCGFKMIDAAKNSKGEDLVAFGCVKGDGGCVVTAALSGLAVTNVSIAADKVFPKAVAQATIQLAFYNLALSKHGDDFVKKLEAPGDSDKLNESVEKLWEKIDEQLKSGAKESFTYEFGISVKTMSTKGQNYVMLYLP